MQLDGYPVSFPGMGIEEHRFGTGNEDGDIYCSMRVCECVLVF